MIYGSPVERARKRVGSTLCFVGGAALVWYLSPGLPVLWAPSARAEVVATGRSLFEHEWQPHDPLAKSGDGLGPVYNAKSCVACHFQGAVGGGGPNSRNVSVYFVRPTSNRIEVQTGVVHAFAVERMFQETSSMLAKMYPRITFVQQLRNGCSVRRTDFDPVIHESINTTALFGAGWLDRISTQSIRHNFQQRSVAQITRELDSDFGGVPAGRLPSLPDGRLGKFGWKAQAASLREFVANACAVEVGLGNPLKEQARPLGSKSMSRVEPDLDDDQFRALVSFVETLPRPVQVLPADPIERNRALEGERLFKHIGCAACHTPSPGGVEGVYSDFLLYDLEDREASSRYGDSDTGTPWPDDMARPEEWKTPPLWGVADSAPFFHDGKCPDLESAILRHKGAAGPVTQRYNELSALERKAVIAFLKTLRAPRIADQNIAIAKNP
jgi:di-heme oxidoreductase (putative peroxidase)